MTSLNPTRERVYTAADLWRLSHERAHADSRLELSEGRLIVMSPASVKHGMLASRFDRAIGNFVEEHGLGVVTAAETGYLLGQADGKDTVRAPDVGFIAKARIPADGLPDRGYFPGAPDLAVEIVSPNDDLADLALKIEQYLRAGARMVIAAHPDEGRLRVHTPEGVRVLGIDDTLDGGAVLPGFAVPVRELLG
jgi:Uma2 family endonuclease